uniref:ileal sodium/bile acid cotransporter-like n=1 Tax=Styela clava TaxID=7725 RepID=UPI0019395FC5|nr:ileal sodium/bile acid cotransporter-like [Styela clava]XP_039253203.1 ileal sodium/bile acid cotransporter-like [Styela clava]
MSTTAENMYIATTRTPCLTINETSFENSTVKPCIPGPTVDDAKLIVQTILMYMVPVLLALIMIGIGCSVEISKLKQHFKNPTGILTGLVCQFIIMPILAYMWASIFSMEEPETLSLLIVGSCPGGTYSNIVSYWIDADMALSTTMTTVSIFASLGMLPLLLYIYSLAFSTVSTRVPFDGLGISIALSIGPLAIGIAMRYKWKKFAIVAAKVLAVIGLVVMVIALALFIYAFIDIWKFQLGLVIAAILYPICGFILGYAISSIVSTIAKPLCLSHRHRRTVAVETGIQNGQIALSIVQLAGWSFQITGRTILFPMMYSIAQVIISLLLIVIYHVIHCIRYGKRVELQKGGEIMKDKSDTTTKETVSKDNKTFEMEE